MVDIQSLIWVCGRGAEHPLHWQRAGAESYDLILQNPDALDPEILSELIAGVGGQIGFSAKARKKFSEFGEDPTRVLPSEAYVQLSNWFMSERTGEYGPGETTDHARKTWDFLFAHRPPKRLSSPEQGKNHIVIPERFDEWWALMEGQQVQTRGSWIFQANPEIYDIVSAIKSLPKERFKVSRYQDRIRKGDRVYVWEAGANRGIVGLAEVLEEPIEQPDIPETVAFYRGDHRPEDSEDLDVRCEIKILGVLEPRVTAKELQEDPRLADLSIVKQPQGTNFILTDLEATILEELTEVRLVKSDGPSTAFERILENLTAQGLYFPAEVVSNYLLGLQAKRFAILTGISGTGETKLATAVARHFRPIVEERRPVDLPEETVVVEAKPYMFKYKRIVIPVAVLDQLSPLVSLGIEPGKKMRIRFPEGEVDLKYWKDPDRRVTVLLFRDAFWEWFKNNLEVGQPFHLRGVETKDEQILLEFGLPKQKIEKVSLENCEVVAVRPDWTDNRGLLGYYNPLINQYSSTPFLELLLRARDEMVRAKRDERLPHPFFAVLDEMNLARVEHYFSDFLSCLESGEPLHLHDDETLEQGESEAPTIPRRLEIPSNLFFTGTVNVDETTYMFSPKVLDRAFTIELNQVDLTQLGIEITEPEQSSLYLRDVPQQLGPVENPSSKDWLEFGELEEGHLSALVVDLNDILAEENRHFGYRVANEIARFVNLAAQQAGASTETLWSALDIAILEKVLPKFHGTQQELEEVLLKLFEFSVTGSIPDSSVERRMIEEEWQMDHGELVPKIDPQIAENPDEGEALEGLLVETGGGQAPMLPRMAAKLFRMLRRLGRQGFTSFIE